MSQAVGLWSKQEAEKPDLNQLLFHSLHQTKDLDKDRLFADMSNKGFQRKQVTDATNHLHQKLSNYLLEREVTQGDELHKQQKLAELYFRLGLTTEALTLVEKAREEAWKREDYNLLIALIHSEQAALERDWSTPEAFARHEALAAEQQKALQAQLKLAFLKELYSRVHRTVLQRHDLSQTEIQSSIQSVLSDPLMQEEENDLAASARLQRKAISYNLARLQNDTASLMKVSSEGVQLFQENPRLMEGKGILYIRWIGILIMNAQQRQAPEQAWEYRTMLQDFHPLHVQVQAEKEFVSVYPFLVFALSQGEQERLSNFIREAEKIRPLVYGLPKDLIFRFYFSLLYSEVALGNFEAARQKLEDLLQGFPDKSPPSVEIHVRLLELIIIEGLSDYELLSYKSESLRKFISRNPGLSPFSALQKLFSRLSNTYDTDKRMALLSQTLEKIVEQENLGSLQRIVDYPAWLRSSLANKPLIHFFAEKKEA